MKITGIKGRQILDSRGRPTVEVDVFLEDGARGRASVPSGASTGSFEAHELRDGELEMFGGLGVKKAVAHVNTEIAAALKGANAVEQRQIDELLVGLDGTAQLTRLGANAILGVSLATSRAVAFERRIPLYQYIAELAGNRSISMPMPMVNILSGGLHASRGMDVQDFLAIPSGAQSLSQAIHMLARVRQCAADLLTERDLSTLLADEGGLSPGFQTSREALMLMTQAIERAGYTPGEQFVIAIDVAATSLYDKTAGHYTLMREGRVASRTQMIEMLGSWIEEFPILSVEDLLDENDWEGWRQATQAFGNKIRLIGDDFFTTNLSRVKRGIAEGCANGVLIKVNQNGTLTGTLDVIAAAKRSGYAAVVSARSGETEDDFIADLAVGTGAGQIKIGSLRCSDRLSKYNQLLRIEEEGAAKFAGMSSIMQGLRVPKQ